MEIWKLDWDCGSLEVQNLAGMLGPLNFKIKNSLEDIQIFQPLMIAPWNDDPLTIKQENKLPPILYSLKGEWPCVPFGSARPVDNLHPEWQKIHWDKAEGPPHGHSSNLNWKLNHKTDSEIEIECEYPNGDPIHKLVRRIKPVPNEPAVNIELEVHPREDCKLGIGLHPTINLEERVGETLLVPGKFRFGMTFPGDIEPTALTKPASIFHSLSEVPLKDGSTKDFSKLPLAENTENLLLLCDVDGTFEVKYVRSGFTLKLEWDAKEFPTVLLWLSNQGRPFYPWSSRFRGCGIEPLCAAFDLGTHVSTSHNMLNDHGIKTHCEFKKGQVWKTSYKISGR